MNNQINVMFFHYNSVKKSGTVYEFKNIFSATRKVEREVRTYKINF